MKRCVLFLLTLLLLLLPLRANAETVYTEGYFYYTVEDGSITIIGYFGTEAEVTVPASIAGIPVNAIGPNAFAGTTVQILHLPDTITELGENATGEASVTFMGSTPLPTTASDGSVPPQGSEPTATPSAQTQTGRPSETPEDAATNLPSTSATNEDQFGEAVQGAEPREDVAPIPAAYADPSATAAATPQVPAPTTALAVLEEQVGTLPEEPASPDTNIPVSEDSSNPILVILVAALVGLVMAAGAAAVIMILKKRSQE